LKFWLRVPMHVVVANYRLIGGDHRDAKERERERERDREREREREREGKAERERERIKIEKLLLIVCA
jgi:hypothetical protein